MLIKVWLVEVKEIVAGLKKGQRKLIKYDKSIDNRAMSQVQQKIMNHTSKI